MVQPFNIPSPVNYLGQARQINRENALMQRDQAMQEQEFQNKQQDRQAAATTAQRTLKEQALLSAARALSRVPAERRAKLYQARYLSDQDWVSAVGPDIAQKPMQDQSLFDDFYLTATLNNSNELTDEQKVKQARGMKEAETVPTWESVHGPNGQPVRRAISPYSTEAQQGVPVSATPGEIMTDRRAASDRLERARQSDLDRKNRLAAAGMDGQGNMVGGAPGGQFSNLVEQVYKGQITQQQAMTRMTAAQKEGFSGAIQQAHPDYDPQLWNERKQAERSFGAGGKEGNQVRFLNTTIGHLDTLRELGRALENGNIQVVNRLRQAWARETGKAPPVSFEAAKGIIAAEIVKAITATGGGVTDREDAQRQISLANNADQLESAIQGIQELLGSQMDGLKLQYESGTGRNDFDTRLLNERTRKVMSGAQQDQVIDYVRGLDGKLRRK